MVKQKSTTVLFDETDLDILEKLKSKFRFNTRTQVLRKVLDEANEKYLLK